MPKIKRITRSEEYETLAREARELKEKGDCAIKAISIVCGVSYKEVRDCLATYGRQPNTGVYHSEIGRAIRHFDLRYRSWTFMEKMDMVRSYPSPHNQLHGITTHHPRRFKKAWEKHSGKKLLIFSSRHVAAFKDGMVHDWSVNASLRVTEIWEILEG